ncbi:DUF1367 family protein [Shewanella algae]|uniref:DUF1367 family protein n=1 Tax=Shewanella algae TaxID=38313 RepID=UPI003D7D1F5C
MAELALIKTATGQLAPLAANDADYVQKMKIGEIARGKFKKDRNPQFHRKYMSLLNLAFDYFEPKPVKYRGQQLTPAKNFDEFRRWIAVQAGFYDVVGYPDGSVRVRAKSISFANMGEDEFSGLYSVTIDVLLAHVLFGKFKSSAEVDAAVDQLLRYA